MDLWRSFSLEAVNFFFFLPLIHLIAVYCAIFYDNSPGPIEANFAATDAFEVSLFSNFLYSFGDSGSAT